MAYNKKHKIAKNDVRDRGSAIFSAIKLRHTHAKLFPFITPERCKYETSNKQDQARRDQKCNENVVKSTLVLQDTGHQGLKRFLDLKLTVSILPTSSSDNLNQTPEQEEGQGESE
ncbi:hypothetical protein PoB_001302400 [Plakobranchus ocellatus]|uniref:Uncharacterized protein n=1 Tax=Plakobranchus ocellatus TaxID=259542 RepID=A0AAV3YTX6_9GAST|nr:hypothetical protein PoB_001302400 [Plakobranchus ocellatus]